MAIDENRCQKCFRGHLDRLQTWDTRMPPTFILPCGFLPHLTNSVSGSFFGSKVFLFPIIITTITSLSAAVVVSQVFGRIRSTGKFLRLLIQFSLWFTSSGGIGLYLTTKVIHMYKYHKQLKELGGQPCHLGKKKYGPAGLLEFQCSSWRIFGSFSLFHRWR